jgi:hypothetical protein
MRYGENPRLFQHARDTIELHNLELRIYNLSVIATRLSGPTDNENHYPSIAQARTHDHAMVVAEIDFHLNQTRSAIDRAMPEPHVGGRPVSSGGNASRKMSKHVKRDIQRFKDLRTASNNQPNSLMTVDLLTDASWRSTR